VLVMKNQAVYADLLQNRAKGRADGSPALGPLPSREWPLLERAADLFSLVQERGPSELNTSGTFNLANVKVKADKLDEAEHLLGTLGASLSGLSWFRIPNWARFSSRRERNPPIESLQVLTLQCFVAALRRSRAHGQPELGQDPFLGSSPTDPGFPESEIPEFDLPATARADLLADLWTKKAYVMYEGAFARNEPSSHANALDAAAEWLRR